MNIFQMKILDNIILLPFIIYSFIKFKVLVSLPKSLHGPLGFKNACNWSTDHAIDHSSIGLNRLTIQLVFNEVSLLHFLREHMALTSRSQRTTLKLAGIDPTSSTLRCQHTIFAKMSPKLHRIKIILVWVGGGGGLGSWHALEVPLDLPITCPGKLKKAKYGTMSRKFGSGENSNDFGLVWFQIFPSL